MDIHQTFRMCSENIHDFQYTIFEGYPSKTWIFLGYSSLLMLYSSLLLVK